MPRRFSRSPSSISTLSPLAAVAGVDPVVGGQLVSGWDPVALAEDAVGDLLREEFSDLGEERRSVIEHGPLPRRRRPV